MSSEQKQVEQLLANKKEYVEGPFQYTEGTIQNNTVILMKCGIGKVNAAAGTVELIRNFHPDCIISTGVAGGIDSGLKVMDVVAGSQIVYHDVWCGEGNAYGQIQGLPALFEGNDKLKALTEDGHSLQIEGIIDRVDTCELDGKTCVRIIDYKSGTKSFSFGNLRYGLDMQMLIYLFSLIYNQTPLQDAKIGGVLYMPAGGVKTNQERGSAKSKQELEQDAYRMSGLLIDDAERIRCMEPDGKGIYIPAKLKVGTSGASELITGKNDVYLSESAFHALYRYVMETLKQTAQQIYQGDIAANPLILPKKTVCKYCNYQDICGNLQQQPCRTTEPDAQEAMLEQLKTWEESEHGMDK